MTQRPQSSRPLAVPPLEGARLLGLGKTRFYELLNAGDIKSFKLGRRRLIRVADLESWLTENSDGVPK